MFDKVLRGGAVTLLVLSLGPGGAWAAILKLTSDTVARQHQDPGTICVELVPRSGEQVAGTENLLVWDGECASILAETCEADPGHGKNLSGTVQRQRDFTYKGLVLSLTDTDPMPAGILYCCDFLVHTAPGGCCRVRIGSPGGSDPDGNSLSMGAGPAAELCVADDGSPSNGGGSGGVLAGGGGGLVDGGGVAAAGGGISGGGPTAGSTGGSGGGSTGGSTGGSGGGSTGTSVGGSSGGPASGLSGGAVADSPAAITADLGGGNRPAGQVPAPARPDAAPARSQATPSRPEAKPAGGRPAVASSKPIVDSTAAQGSMPAGATPKEATAPAKAKDGDTADSDAEDPGVTDKAASDSNVTVLPEDAEKPSPRDVRRAQSAGAASRDRRMPLDDEGGWFGCQTTAADRSGRALALALPALVLLLARRRRRI